jgi:hypothetical protein
MCHGYGFGGATLASWHDWSFQESLGIMVMFHWVDSVPDVL